MKVTRLMEKRKHLVALLSLVGPEEEEGRSPMEPREKETNLPSFFAFL